MRDLSQVVSRTPWDTPVPFYTRTYPLPSDKDSAKLSGELSSANCLKSLVRVRNALDSTNCSEHYLVLPMQFVSPFLALVSTSLLASRSLWFPFSWAYNPIALW